MKSRELLSNSMTVQAYIPRLKDCCRLQSTHRHRPPYCTHSRRLTVDLSRRPEPAQQNSPPAPETQRHPVVTKAQPLKAEPGPKEEPLNVEQQLFNLLHRQNRKFYDEKRKVCCKKRPPRQRFNIGPRVVPQSTYGADYTPKKAHPNTRIEFPLEPLRNLPQQKQSEYLAEYPEHPLPEKYRKSPEKALPQHPFIGHTTYDTFHNGARASPADIILPFDSNDYVPGLPFQGKTVYGKDFGPKKGQRAKSFCQPRRKKQHVKIPLRTTYGDHFVPKDWPRSGSMGPIDVTVPHPKGEYGTEYRDQFPPKHGHTLNKCHYSFVGESQLSS